MELPINSLKKNREDNIFENLNIIQMHLAKQKEKQLKKYLIIFLDDFDYVEDNLFELLEHFLPFASSYNKKSSTVLSARPALHQAINSYDNRFACYFTRDVQRIKLKTLATTKLLSKRLAPILLEEKLHPFKNLINILLRKDASYRKLMKHYGIDDFDSLKKFNMPFTQLYNNFMTSITNGNIREIFDISYETLVFILNNYEDIEEAAEYEENELVMKKNLTDENVMQLFFDQIFDEKKGYKNQYKLINIHEYRSKSGNSLIYNVLEAVKIFEYSNDEFYDNLSKFGHKKEQVDKIISILENKSHRMITPTKVMPSQLTEKSMVYKHYRTTEKGDYYLTNIAFWKEYIERCGDTGKSLRKNL